MRVLELFAGIGGVAAALGEGVEVVAVEQGEVPIRVYRANHAHPVLRKNIASLRPRDLPDADLWWMSPPCQPYTVRGRRRDLDDPRSLAFLRALDLLEVARPEDVALENVPGFAGSEGHARLRAVLDAGGWQVAEAEICPTALGIPNVRRRFFLAASRRGPVAFRPPPRVGRPLGTYLDAEPEPALRVEADLMRRYEGALHVVDAGEPGATTACFTSAYGRSPVYCGSYLQTSHGLRRFSPAEILRLLHFPPAFALPADLPVRKGWDVVGNSVNVACVREVLAALGR